jgi:hypothetical protein
MIEAEQYRPNPNAPISNLGITAQNEIIKEFLTNFAENNQIHHQFLMKFYNLTLEEFQTFYEKLLTRVNTDMVFKRSFKEYLREIVKMVYKVTYGRFKASSLNDIEHGILIDIVNYNFNSNRSNFFYSVNKSSEKNMKTESFKQCYNYEKRKECRAGKNSTITRHNYEIVNKNTLICTNCGYQIKNINNHENKINLSRKKIEDLEKNKQFGDITIYRAYFSGIIQKGKLIKLKFPGISYVGQTIENAIRRLKYGHIKNAFNEKKKSIHTLKILLIIIFL